MPNIAARLSSIGSALNSSRGSIPTVIEEHSLLPTSDTDSAPPTNVVLLNEGEKSYNGSENDMFLKKRKMKKKLATRR